MSAERPDVILPLRDSFAVRSCRRCEQGSATGYALHAKGDDEVGEGGHRLA